MQGGQHRRRQVAPNFRVDGGESRESRGPDWSGAVGDTLDRWRQVFWTRGHELHSPESQEAESEEDQDGDEEGAPSDRSTVDEVIAMSTAFTG